MIEANDGLPLLAPSARGLGIRRDVDIPVDEFGDVEPGDEGMSVTASSLSDLPEFRRPAELGGTGKDPVWEMDSDELPPRLTVVSDDEDPTHALIAPAESMTIEEYEGAIAETRAFWRRCA
jgi:hypothetical protein